MTSRAFSPVLVPVLVIVATAGCPDLRVPPGAHIECDSADPDPCPQGTRCELAIGRCVANEGAIDTIPPGIVGDVELSRDAARRGDVVEVRFVVSEPLFFDPKVTLEMPGGRLPFVLDETATSRAQHRFQLSLTVPEDAPPGAGQRPPRARRRGGGTRRASAAGRSLSTSSRRPASASPPPSSSRRGRSRSRSPRSAPRR